MTDSSIDKNSGEGGFDSGPSMEELFGDIEDESLEGEQIDRQEDDPKDDEEIEDLTAADVFNQLRDEVSANDGAESVLEEASPEDIIASADEPVVEDEEIDDDLVDEGALDNLLLTGRTKGEEFLWVDSGDSTDSSESTDAMPGLTESGDDADGAESAASTDGHAPAGTKPTEGETTDGHTVTDREGAPKVTDRTDQDEEVEPRNEDLETEATRTSPKESEVSPAEPEASTAESKAPPSEPGTPTSEPETQNSESAAEDLGGRREYSLESSVDEREHTTAADTKDDAADESEASLDDTGFEESAEDTATPETLEDGDETGGEIVLSDVEKDDTEMVPAEDDERSGGFFAWIRSKLPF